MPPQLALILVGDHLGQVKRISLPSYKVSPLDNCASPSSANPVVSIEPFEKQQEKQLIGNKNGELYIYDCFHDKTKACKKASEGLNKALPIENDKILLVYDKQILVHAGKGSASELIKQKKKGEIKNAKVNDGRLAYAGLDSPLKIFDIRKKAVLFEAEPPEKDWLGIQPDTYVSGIEFVGCNRVVTCSKSDSVIRVYDTQCKPKPIISVDIGQTAFNEHADSARFTSVASTGDEGHSIVVGSNVGQILAIDLRFGRVKQQQPSKRRRRKLQPKTHKVLGGFKGSRGGSIKDIKIVPAVISRYLKREDTKDEEQNEGDESEDEDDYDNMGGDGETTSELEDTNSGYKVISCCLDRYLRIHNFTRNTRRLDKHVYMTTKPYCCSPVLCDD